MSKYVIFHMLMGGGGFVNEVEVANIISWSKCIMLGMNADWFKEHQIFVLYASGTTRGLRTELVLHVDVMFLQGLFPLISIATLLGLYT